MPDLLSLALQIRSSLDKQDNIELRRISAEFQRVVDRLEGDIDAVSRDMIDEQDIEQTRSFQRLMTRTETALDEFTDFLKSEFLLLASLWLGLGASNSFLLMQQGYLDAGVAQEVKPMSALILESLNRYLDDGSPLLTRLEGLGVTNIERLRTLILDSVSAGRNPRELARRIVADGFGMTLTDALRMARTLQLYAYREATLANYQENSTVIKGWIWLSALIPGRTCMSCVNMHGTEHGLDEILNDHHNGLCTMLPLVRDNPITERGEIWFEGLTKAQQVQMMGQSKWDAWKAGVVSISDMTGIHDDPVYGEMRFERSLKDLLGGE